MTAPPSSSRSSNAARSATPPLSSGCSARTCSVASTPPVEFLLDDELAEAADVLADAALGHWAAGVLPPLVRRELTGPFDQVVDRGLVSAPPVDDALIELLDHVRGLDAPGRAAWRVAVDEGRADHRPWATAMHEASWAGHVSGRTRSLAAAQLHAVQAFLDGGFDLHDGAAGVWNALAGCVQGTAVADLLDEASLSRPPGALGACQRPLSRTAPSYGTPCSGRRRGVCIAH